MYIVTGPILIFFATSVMLPGVSQAEYDSMQAHYFGVSRKFFVILALLQLWDIGVDILLGRGFSGAAIFSIVMLAIALALMSSQNTRLHILGTVVVWLLFLSSLLLRGFGVVV